MNEIFYLEADEEITSVIDRLRKAESKSVAFVIPRGGSLAQSIVNLKLLKKSAAKLGIDFSLVTTDRISRNLASQVGLSVFSKVSEAEKAVPKEDKFAGIPISEEGKGGFRINSYYAKKEAEEVAEEEPTDAEELEEEAGSSDIIDESDASDNEDVEPDEEDQIEVKTAAEDKPVEKKPEEPVPYKPKFSEPEKPKHEPIVEKKEGGNHMSKSSQEGAFRNAQQKPRNFAKTRKILLAIMGGCLVLILALSYIFVPYAEATLVLKTEEAKLEKELTVDSSLKAVDQTTLAVPGKTVSIEKDGSKTYDATGTKDVGTKATGKITVYNEWSTTPETLSKGTKFASGGKNFLLTSDVSVPGAKLDPNPPIKFIAGSVEASAEAENSGDTYNLAATSFSIPSLPLNQQGKIYGRSTVAMAGGTTKSVKVITDADLKEASVELAKSLLESSKEELLVAATDAKAKIFINNATSEILSESSAKNVGDQADNFEYSVKLKISALSFIEADAKAMIIAEAEKVAGEGRMLVNPDKAEITYTFVSNKSTSVMKMTASLVGKSGQKMDVGVLRNGIKNKKYSEARTYLASQNGVESAEINVWPSPVFRVPFLKNRITVKFDYQQ